MASSRTRITPGMVHRLEVRVVQGINFGDWFIKSVHQAEMIIILYRFPLVPFLVV